jgi:hypothetical protein
MPKKKPVVEINNLVVISDTHCGCRVALCHPDGASLDDGGDYMPSGLQKKLWSYWRTFWDEFVPEATRNEPFAVIHNGDAIDGVHHGSTTQISNNLEDQGELAYRILEPVVEACQGRYYHIRGTEAHVGKSAVEEERLAKRLGAIPNETGQYARYDLWARVGPKLTHFLHHIGSTGSQAYEATAPHKEVTEELIESVRWGNVHPDVVVRSHRHRAIETRIPGVNSDGKRGWISSVVTPCWQAKTPFAWKIPGARLSTPQFGGIVIRYAHGELFTRCYVETIDRSRTV